MNTPDFALSQMARVKNGDPLAGSITTGSCSIGEAVGYEGLRVVRERSERYKMKRVVSNALRLLLSFKHGILGS